MALKTETSLIASLSVATIVFTIYNQGLPSQADVRVGKVGDETIEQVRKQNAWMAAAVVSGISLLTRDTRVFTTGAAMVVGLDWLTRSNNWANPLTNRVDVDPGTVDVPADMGAARGDLPYSEPGLATIA